MRPWRARLYFMLRDLINSSAFSVAAFIEDDGPRTFLFRAESIEDRTDW